MWDRLASIASSVILAGCSVLGIRGGYEQPPYEVLERRPGGVELRRYGARLAAETTVELGERGVEGARREAFERLAGYIFGGNRTRDRIAMTAPVETRSEGETIAMTAPVETRPDGDALAMRFFLPARWTRDAAPVPEDARVRLVDAPGETLAVLRFSGLAREPTLAKRRAELVQAVEEAGWRPAGAPFELFYDPPWTLPFLRRNEVAVAVEVPPGAG